jgi:oligopeptide/dipeptide ABC transporter ATP-binding protein
MAELITELARPVAEATIAPHGPPLVDVQNVTVRFRRKRTLASLMAKTPLTFRAVAEADMVIARQEVVGLVGESGSGKTTLGRTILRLYEPAEGAIVFEGEPITHLREGQLRAVWRRMSLVFQDPLSSLNPRHTIRTALAAPLLVHEKLAASAREDRVREALGRVGLPGDVLERYPHELSGGQLQRVALARALMLNPALLIADEAVSKLDVSVRSQILNLFKDLQETLNISFLFITHDLHVARYISDRIVVMFFGRIIESAPARELFRAPRHPYTKALLGTIDEGDEPALQQARNSVDPDAQGCIYQSRCPRRLPRCAEAHPPTGMVGREHTLACFNPL